jgi:hypothetical protein
MDEETYNDDINKLSKCLIQSYVQSIVLRLLKFPSTP